VFFRPDRLSDSFVATSFLGFEYRWVEFAEVSVASITVDLSSQRAPLSALFHLGAPFAPH